MFPKNQQISIVHGSNCNYLKFKISERYKMMCAQYLGPISECSTLLARLSMDSLSNGMTTKVPSHNVR